MPKELQTKPRAQLIELIFYKTQKQGDLLKQKGGRSFEVQFNPQTLAVNYLNRNSGNDQQVSSGVQFVGKGSSSLSVELLFDVTRPDENADDVRELTKRVREFLRDRKKDKKKGSQKGKYIPPGVRFMWGSLMFDGVMDSMSETLELFDPEGTPLRATVSISIQEIQAEPKQGRQASGPNSAASGEEGGDPEERPEGAENTNGTSVQQAAAEQGEQDNWKKIAERSGVENPRAIYNQDALSI